jgi:hypothetical protein
MNASKSSNGNEAEVFAKRSVAPANSGQPNPVRSTAKKVGKRAPEKKTKAGGPQANANKRAKSEKLVCRYCGSDDLAPSFIKRRDRRCRKCFSKRYGSVTRTKKRKVKK